MAKMKSPTQKGGRYGACRSYSVVKASAVVLSLDCLDTALVLGNLVSVSKRDGPKAREHENV